MSGQSSRSFGGFLRRSLAGFLLAVSAFSFALAQEDPRVFISAEGGIIVGMAPYPWVSDGNSSILAGYRLWSGVRFVTCFDHSTFAGLQQSDDPLRAAGYQINSFLAGTKLSSTTTNNRVSPYCVVLLGVSNVVPFQDSIRVKSMTSDEVKSYKTNSGKTGSYLAAAGADIKLHDGLFVSFEVRASSDFNTRIYQMLWMYRAGIGVAFL